MADRDLGEQLPQAADLYGDIAPPPETRWQDYLPGLIVAVLATMAAAYLADHYGAPLTLLALLIGLSLNFLGQDKRLRIGLGFASRTLLRTGILLLGARVTLGDMLALGPEALLAVLTIVALTMAVGVLGAERSARAAHSAHSPAARWRSAAPAPRSRWRACLVKSGPARRGSRWCWSASPPRVRWRWSPILPLPNSWA